MQPGKHIPVHAHRDSNTGGKLATQAPQGNAGVLDSHVSASDPHPGYVREADANYVDLTDGGATTLHSHAGGGSVATDAIFDAKGDLPVGTGADTADNLTVGANDTILMADSGQATGLKWVASQTPSTQAFGDAAAEGTADTFSRGDHKHAMPSPGVYADFTPTLTADGGDPNLGSTGSASGRYTQIGDMVHTAGVIIFGGTGISAGSGTYEIAYPVAPADNNIVGSAVLFDSSASFRAAATPYFLDAGEFRIVFGAGTATGLVTHALPWTWAAGDFIRFSMTYEAA